MIKTAKDKYNRYRSVTVAFRVSPEENKMINRMVALSGMTKQDYITKRLEDTELTILPNPRMYKGLKNILAEVLEELKKLKQGDTISPDLLEIIKVVANALGDMKG